MIITAYNTLFQSFVHHPCTHSLGIISAGGYRPSAQYHVTEQAEGVKRNPAPRYLDEAFLLFWISLLGNFWSVHIFPLWCKPNSFRQHGTGTHFQLNVGTCDEAPLRVITHDLGSNSHLLSTFCRSERYSQFCIESTCLASQLPPWKVLLWVSPWLRLLLYMDILDTKRDLRWPWIFTSGQIN